jgi:hypothetical protein
MKITTLITLLCSTSFAYAQDKVELKIEENDQFVAYYGEAPADKFEVCQIQFKAPTKDQWGSEYSYRAGIKQTQLNDRVFERRLFYIFDTPAGFQANNLNEAVGSFHFKDRTIHMEVAYLPKIIYAFNEPGNLGVFASNVLGWQMLSDSNVEAVVMLEGPDNSKFTIGKDEYLLQLMVLEQCAIRYFKKPK